MAAVVDDKIIANIPGATADEIYQFEVQIEELSERQTKEPIIFIETVDETGQKSIIRVPSEKLNDLEEDSSYLVKVVDKLPTTTFSTTI